MATHIRATPAEQQRFLTVSEEVLRQTFVRLLARIAAADTFLKSQLTKDTSPRVRTTIAQTIAADARWMALPDSAALLEGVIASDPDPAVSLAALETLRRWRMRHLNTLLNERVAMARNNAGVASVAPLLDAQERWVSLERGTMLPAFLRSPAPHFTAVPVDQPLRVVAFGDFGTGSDAQKALAQTLGAYHKDRPFSLGITLGDNFYSVGMESPADPRWETQWEQMISRSASRSTALWETMTGDIPTARQPRSCSPRRRAPGRCRVRTTRSRPARCSSSRWIHRVLRSRSRQLEWLDTELSRSQARWKVVYGHHPIFSGGAYEDRPDLIEKLLPFFGIAPTCTSAATTITFRRFARKAVCISTLPEVGGAGLYELRPYERSLFATSMNGFAVLDADPLQLNVSLVDGTGKTVYSETLKKEPTSIATGRAHLHVGPPQ